MYKIHNPVELDEQERDVCRSMLEDMGLTEDEADLMLEDFEMGY